VENLDHESKRAVVVAKQYIMPLLSDSCDQLVLGCTHFSFLRTTIDNVVRGRANIVDTAIPVAAELKRRLYGLDHQSKNEYSGQADFWTSGDPENIKKTISQLWGDDVSLSQAL